MKRFIVVASMLALVAVMARPVHLAAQAPAKIAVLNVQQAIAESEEGKREAATLNAKANAKRAELERLQKEVETMQKQLQDQATTLNDDAKAQLARQIDQKSKDLQRQQQDAQEEFQSLSAEVVNRIGNKMMRVVAQYAQEQGLTAVFDSSSAQTTLLWFVPTVNITTEIIRRYDAANASAPKTAPATKPAPTNPPVKK
ncbi:MAG: OmpH family outer membrane protein [Acidobacteriia bacterium]|nr:OmpH family outer membrane protein [Terriglobia bacterium]